VQYNEAKSMQVLERTPALLRILLTGLHEDWIMSNEGPETFSPYDVVGHLVHGEKTDWVPRTKMILEYGSAKPFEPYDRFAQYRDSEGKSLTQLLVTLTATQRRGPG
jgi:hypothetical protein